jgi:hypothetical protein
MSALVFETPWVSLCVGIGDTPALLGCAVIQGFFTPHPWIGLSLCFACSKLEIVFIWTKDRVET